MDKRERVLAALDALRVDRPPFSLWRHFHRRDREASTLAQATLEFAHTYDLDLIKLTPGNYYAIEDYGADVRHFGDDDTPPELVRPVVERPTDWRRLPLLNPTEGSLGLVLEAIEQIANATQGTIPLIFTVFSPLTIAQQMVGDRIWSDLRGYPNDVRDGLNLIAETQALFVERSLQSGADGIFFAVRTFPTDLLTPRRYRGLVEPADRQVLDAAREAPIRILHLHGAGIPHDLFAGYNVHAWSWERLEECSISTFRAQRRKAVVGGLDRDWLVSATPDQIRERIDELIDETGGRALIVGPSCALRTDTPHENLLAVRQSLER